MKLGLVFCFVIIASFLNAQTGWQQISSFGTNPGNLNGYVYVPTGLTTACPLVVAMHGCTQTAQQYRDNSGWNNLADTYKFIVLYPEQKSLNNSYTCFNWFLPGDQDRSGGEAESIYQMVQYVQSHYAVNNNKIFATGLSAGGSMTAVMMACYPDVFKAGAPMSGVPYKAASDAITASNAMYGLVTKTPQEWATLAISGYSTWNGTYPKVAVFHGTLDNVVAPANAVEMIEQWTQIQGESQTPFATQTSFNGAADVERSLYGTAGDTVAVYYKISNMGHAIAVDPGSGAQQGGAVDTYSIDKNFYSTYWAARFFGLTDITQEIADAGLKSNAYTIAGNKIVFSSVIPLVKVFDETGKCMMSKTNILELNLENLHTGLFLIRPLFSQQNSHLAGIKFLKK